MYESGLIFDDYGETFKLVTASRTIGDFEISSYATFAGFFEELFLSEVAAAASIYGRRIAPGSLTFALAEGLIVQSGILHGTALAFLGVDAMRIPQPVYLGDTIKVVAELASKRLSNTNPDRGIVITTHAVLNQTEEVVMEYRVSRLISVDR